MLRARSVPSSDTHRSGFVAICGRPNVGKSTLLNALLGEPVAVATPYPQTTRERLLGIWTEDDFQAVLVDTPGIHRARSALNEFMVRQAVAAARDVDLVLLLDEVPALRDAAAGQAWEPGEVARQALEMLAALGHPIVLVLTKVDRLRDRSLLLPVLAKWGALHEFAAIVPTAALQDEGLAALRAEVVARLPLGPQLYPPEDLSDRGMRWHAAEHVRAELFEHLGDELPYCCAVRIDRYEHRRDRDRVHATIFVERDSQKGMVIGKGGRVVGAVRTGAQARIERLAGRPCELHLSVDVAKNWTKDPSKLEQLGYSERGLSQRPLAPGSKAALRSPQTGADTAPGDPEAR
jgi:GTP-binding protein Era